VSVQGPPQNCYVPQCSFPAACPNEEDNAEVPRAAADADGGTAAETPPVTVLSNQVVGPYETVQLQSSDPGALTNWLTSHQYAIGPDAQVIVDQYVAQHFNFLALKLVPGEGVQAMRPVRITMPGAALGLPLRMIGAGAGANVGVTLWVIGEGRYEPQNFPFFTLGASDVAWDWTTNSSNYNQVRADRIQSSGGRAWQIESSLSILRNQVADPLTQQLDYENNYEQRFGQARLTSAGGQVDYPATTDGGSGETSSELLEDDISALFAGSGSDGVGRVTRIRSDLAHAALAQDLILQASTDQSELSNFVQVTKELNEPMCAVYNQSCGITGMAPRSQANATNHALVNPAYPAPTCGGLGAVFSCSAAPRDPGEGAGAAIAAMLGLTIVRARRLRASQKK
jgi:hypothetical protein